MSALSELFHVSSSRREFGWQPTVKSKTWADSDREEIESALDAQRPANAPSRRTSYFAFATIEECVLYAEREKIEAPCYYRVKLLQAVRAPMTLEFVPPDLEQYRDAIYRHYWKSDDSWKVYEYFSPQMVVVSECSGAVLDSGAAFQNLIEDRKRLKQMAPTLTA